VCPLSPPLLALRGWVCSHSWPAARSGQRRQPAQIELGPKVYSGPALAPGPHSLQQGRPASPTGRSQAFITAARDLITGEANILGLWASTSSWHLANVEVALPSDNLDVSLGCASNARPTMLPSHVSRATGIGGPKTQAAGRALGPADRMGARSLRSNRNGLGAMLWARSSFWGRV
jgi:hypothetical protein